MESKIQRQKTSPVRLIADKNYPLVVDLDGTLIKTDLLYEGVIMLLRKNSSLHFPVFTMAFKRQSVFQK